MSQLFLHPVNLLDKIAQLLFMKEMLLLFLLMETFLMILSL